MRQSSVAALHGSGTRKSRRLTEGVGRSRAARCFKIVKILSHLTRNLLCSVNPEFASTIDSQSLDSSVVAKTIDSSILACLARSVSSQQMLLNTSNFLAIFCFIFSEESTPRFQISTQTYFVSLSLISQLIRLLQL